MKFFIICNVLNSFLISGVVLADNTERRSHNHQPSWIDHCWDEAGTHLLDPFCQLLKDACTDVPTVDNASFETPDNTNFGAVVSYTCNKGYEFVAGNTVKCLTGAEWSRPYPVCRLVCTDVPTIDNASFETPNNTNIGVVVSYTCNKGYELVAGNTVECLTGGAWSRPYPVCRLVCPSVPEITNGYSNGVTSTSIGTTVEYNCNEGYTIVDNNSTVCLYNINTNTASWSSLPECTEITCEPPQLTTYTEFVFNETSPLNETTFFINDTVLYRCQAGYFFSDLVPDNGITGTPDTVTDSGNASSGTEIVYPTVEANDSENGDELTTTTEYSTTTSDASISLDTENGTYSGNETDFNETGIYEQTTTTTQPPTTTITELPPQITEATTPTQSITCQLVGNKPVWTTMRKCAIDCGTIPNVDNAARTTPENTLVGAVVQYTCLRGYERSGPKNVTCLNTGSWSELPYCRSVCPEALVVDNSYITNIQYYSREKDSELYYVCNDGYTLVGPEVVTCIDTLGSKLPLNWSPAPFCRPACEIPPYISNGTRTEPDNLLVGVTVTYTCDSDFHLKGPAVSTCLRWGNWTEAPNCVHYCKVPPFVPNSKYETFSYTESEVVIFTCKERYRLIGNDTLTCQNGTWTLPYPVCDCVVKPIDVIFIVDGSGSMGAGGFQKTLDFVSDMVNRYPFDTTQFGLLVFSSNATPQFYLNQFTTNKTELNNKIQSTKFPSGNTVTYDALEVARTDMFTEANGMRPNVSQIAIIVTDGKSGEVDKVRNQSQLLRNEGVTIYSVGVGDTDQTELDSMASNQSFVFHVGNYNAISAIEGPLAGVTCESLGDDELWSDDDDEDLWIV